MFNLFKKIITNKFHIDNIDKIDNYILWQTVKVRIFMLCRGILRFHKCIFVGRNVRFIALKRISLGKYVTFWDSSHVDASSARGIVIGDYCSIGRNTFIRTGNIENFNGYFILGDNSSCGPNSYFGATGGISIGKNVLMGPCVVIHSETHIYDDINKDIKSQGVISKPVVIEDNVWIGSNVVILGGVTIGKGAIIGAGSIITKDVEPFSIVVGNPAKLMKFRY